mmetsp:Transcript_23728/g.27991  ORF Transcript_23728/g.27991 Transcript_23728/m.27991 type:complete len:97 (-) Transcript_23728:204-494(-)
MVYVYIVIHRCLPTYSMHLRDDMYSQPIDHVNAQNIAIFKTEKAAKKCAKEYFFESLEYEDNGESEEGGYYMPADKFKDHTCGTWDEEVYVESQEL